MRPSRIAFGLFEADLKSGELWKSGHRVSLQGQPFKVLTILLENHGEVVSREEIEQQIWGTDVVVDFEHSLGSAIKKVRAALGDSADNPRFIETLSRRGYRFIAPVTVLSTSEHDPAQDGFAAPDCDDPNGACNGRTKYWAIDVNDPPSRWRFAIPAVTFLLGVGLAVGLFGLVKMLRHSDPTPLQIVEITHHGRIYSQEEPELESSYAIANAGERLFATTVEDGQIVLSQIYVPSGETKRVVLPSSIRSPRICDISPDRTRLLVRSESNLKPQGPLWIVPVDGEAPFRAFGITAQDATWMRDGKNILYAASNKLYVAEGGSGTSREFATLAGAPFWLRWSPNGEMLRFSIVNPVDHTSAIWETSASGGAAHKVFDGRLESGWNCCGTWSADGRMYVFQRIAEGHADLWEMNAGTASKPRLLTHGPLNYESPTVGTPRSVLYFIGRDAHSVLGSINKKDGSFVPRNDFLSDAVFLSLSRDQRWIAWLDSGGALWRAHHDGSDRVQLVPSGFRIADFDWAPDDSRIIFSARWPGERSQIFLIGSEGGKPEPLAASQGEASDPSFSADGTRIVFSETSGDEAGSGLRVLDFGTNRVTTVPSSERMVNPRWSPDGRYIAAVAANRSLMLFDENTQRWTSLAQNLDTSDLIWSPHSESLFVQAWTEADHPILEITVRDGRIRSIFSQKNVPGASTGWWSFSGLLPDNSPLVRVHTSIANIYSTQLDKK